MMGQVKIENAEIREAIERAKREHVHEWQADEEGAVCMFPDCFRTMSSEEINRRLNATEGLNAITARIYSEHIVEDPPFLIDECSKALLAYAAALEEENDQAS